MTKAETPSIRAVRVSKWYGRVTALQGVSVELGPGIWGLLGPNGSGKSTFMGLVAGQLTPSRGELLVAGRRPFDAPEVLARVGYCPEADALFEELSALTFVRAMAELSGVPRDAAGPRAEAILTRLGLADAMRRPVGGFSRGMRQRVKLAQALVHDPDVIVLDEPLTGTDPISRQAILAEIRARASVGALVLFSTHVLHEVEGLTDQVLLLARGQVVAQGTTDTIRRMMEDRPHHIRVACGDPRALARALVAAPATRAVYLEEDAVTLATHAPDETYAAVSQAVLELGADLRSITSPDATLEALFHDLVERASRGAGTGADRGEGHHAHGGPP